MLAQATHTLMTADEFERWIALPENDDRLLELIHGEVTEKMPTQEHGKIAAIIVALIWQFMVANGIKGHPAVEARFRRPQDPFNSRLPDVSVHLTDAPVVKRGPVLQMPDLAIEVQSPHDRPSQMRSKALYYLQNGSQIVWLLYPADQKADVCTLDENGTLAITVVEPDGVLQAASVLPGFALSMKTLFGQV